MCTAEARGREHFHTKPSVSPSDFFHTSVNTLFTEHLFAPWAPGAPRVLQATDGPLCCTTQAQGGRKQTTYTPRGAPDTIMSFCWPTYDIIAWFSHICFTQTHTENIQTLLLRSNAPTYGSKNTCNCMLILYVWNSRGTHTHTKWGTVKLVWDWLKLSKSRAKDKKTWASMKPLFKKVADWLEERQGIWKAAKYSDTGTRTHTEETLIYTWN